VQELQYKKKGKKPSTAEPTAQPSPLVVTFPCVSQDARNVVCVQENAASNKIPLGLFAFFA
jgi:hypothetical protein